MKKTMKIIIIILSVVIVVGLAIFIYLYSYAANHNLYCSRMNGIIFESYTFDFNMFKQIKNVSMQVMNEYNTEEGAISEYENAKNRGENVKLDNKKVIYYFDEFPVQFPKELDIAKSMCEDWLYTCEMVKK